MNMIVAPTINDAVHKWGVSEKTSSFRTQDSHAYVNDLDLLLRKLLRCSTRHGLVAVGRQPSENALHCGLREIGADDGWGCAGA